MKRPSEVWGKTVMVKTGCGKAYITISIDEFPEIFATLGKSGGCSACHLQALTRVISVALQAGVSATKIYKQLVGSRCPQDSHYLKSCPDAVAHVMEKYLTKGEGDVDEAGTGQSKKEV